MATRKLNTSTTPSKTKKQVFIEEYLRTLNSTTAAIAAGYSEKSARQAGYRLLTDADIRAEIDTALAQRAEVCGCDTQWVIEQVKALALDPSVPPKDRVKALDLLGRYSGAWTGGDVKGYQGTINVVLREGGGVGDG